MSALAPEHYGDEIARAPGEAIAAPTAKRSRGFGLAARLLLVTIASVVTAIGPFYLTRLALSRENWLRDRIFAARTAAMVFGADAPDPLPRELAQKILDAVGAKMITISGPGKQIVISNSDALPPADYTFDNTDPGWFEGLAAAIRTILAPENSTLLVAGPGPSTDSRVEILIDQTPLIDQMWRLSRNIALLSLMVSAVVIPVLWGALWQLVIRPVRRLTDNIVAFGANPQNLSGVMAPSGRDDEIGRAESALASMQTRLAHELGQRKRLAELGLAVARINHDLRNMLATAQLISDRFATIADPLAQRLAPQLVATLDRAIEFCQSTLVYGAARDRSPMRHVFDLRALVEEIVETEAAAGANAICYAIEIPPKFELYADRDHVRRALENLARNAAQALKQSGRQASSGAAVRFAAIRTADDLALIEVSDSGPGLPPGAEDHIFEPFHDSTRSGGSGLGLAIAGDLVERNGGSIRLAPAEPEDFYCGARFLITLPAPKGARRAALTHSDA